VERMILAQAKKKGFRESVKKIKHHVDRSKRDGNSRIQSEIVGLIPI